MNNDERTSFRSFDICNKENIGLLGLRIRISTRYLRGVSEEWKDKNKWEVSSAADLNTDKTFFKRKLRRICQLENC